MFSRLGIGRSILNRRLMKIPTNSCHRTEIHRNKSVFQNLSSHLAVTWKSLLITGSITGAAAYFVSNMRRDKEKRNAIERKRILGKASIGGPFELVDPSGKMRSSQEFKNQWVLIYFGFTHCPDICPDELEKMVKVVDKIDADDAFPNIQPIFISVDPARDTPELVGKYIAEFSPKFIGLTGSPEQVDKVCKAFRVYYSQGPADPDNDYIVDHTIITYLINPNGEFVDYFGQTKDVEEMVGGIEMQMLKHEKMKEYEIPTTSGFFKRPIVEVSKN